LLLAVASVVCWVLATRSRRTEVEEPPRAPLRRRAEEIRDSCRQELQIISNRLDQSVQEIDRTKDIQDEKARLQALADLANKRKNEP
jgi:sensor domain CHASE-containing protein